MTITTTTVKINYTGNGSTTVFATNFPIYGEDHVDVYLDGVLKTITTHYTVSGVGGATASITFGTAPATDVVVSLKLSPPITQEADYVNGEAINLDTLEQSLDLATQVSQTINDQLGRTLSAPSSVSASFSGELASLGGAGYLLRVTSDQLGFEAVAASAASLGDLSPTDGNIIVGDGTSFVVESGATARTSLGLGSISTQDSSSVSITGGSVTGITDIAVADGGTGASTAAGARTSLGLVIGTDVQAYDANIITTSSASTLTNKTLTSPVINGALTGTAIVDEDNMVSDSATKVPSQQSVKAYVDTQVASVAATNVVEDLSPQLGAQLDVNGYGLGDGTLELLTFTETASAVNHVNITNNATGSAPTISSTGDDVNVGLTIDSKGTGAITVGSADSTIVLTGTSLSGSLIVDEDNMVSDSAVKVPTQQSVKAYADTKQPLDAGLTDIAALAVTDGNIIVGDGTNWVAESGATARTSLGLAIGTDVQAYDAGLADIASLAVTDGNIIVGNGTNWAAESGATARTSLGLTIGTDVQAYDANIVTTTSTSTLTNKTLTSPVISSIVSVSAGDIAITPHTTGNLVLDGLKWPQTDGATNHVLKTDGAGQLAWAAAGGGGSGGTWAELTSVTASASASIEFTSFSTAYRMYKLVMTDVYSSTNAVYMTLAASIDAGVTYDQSFSYHIVSRRAGASAPTDTGGTGVNPVGLQTNTTGFLFSSTAARTQSGEIMFSHEDNNFHFRSNIWGSGSSAGQVTESSTVGATGAAVDSIKLAMSAGNIAAGTFTLYGLV